MDTTFHFTSAQEITPDIIDVIKLAYQEKSVSIYVQEYETVVPEWHIQEVKRRDAITKNYAECFFDVDEVMCELESELETK